MILAAIIFIVTFGCLGHFIYEWSGHKPWCGLIFATNESTWEHIKLTIYPTVLWAVFEGIRLGWTPSLLQALAAALLTEMILVPALFYSYTAVVGRNFLITDIICFVISVVAGVLVFYKVLSLSPAAICTVASIGIIAVVLTMYFRWTFHAPHNFLFRDPISGGFGPQGHDCDEDFHGIHSKHKHKHNK